MNYLNMGQFFQIQLGHIVKTAKNANACEFIIKRIQSDFEQVYIVPLDSSFPGQWESGNGLFYVRGKK
jgi:hypothetical protein